jgi:hypothetical protein
MVGIAALLPARVVRGEVRLAADEGVDPPWSACRVASSKAACKAAAQPSGAPKRPSLAQSMGSGGEPSGSGSVPQKRQSSAAIPNGKHPK